MALRLRIPKSFQLFGHTIPVTSEPDLVETMEAYGYWEPEKLRIRLQKGSRKYARSFIEVSYCHELAHAILDITGHEKLSSDEKFVEQLGQALHQVLTTSKYK